ncbi:MAG TPA: 50S ribosomal protein L5, partial [Opitutales bacterium]|nr:50S ribosomal protein L5 [Opitutales bacterium]
MPVLKKFYQEEVIPELKKKFSIENIHDVPKLVKIVINTGVGAKNEKQYLEDVQRDMGLIAGQKAVATKARVSVSNFKLREGMPVGVRVTL